MLIDTHCHLDVTAFDADRREVIARAHSSGVVGFINPSYDRISSHRAVALANENEDIFAAVGIHPNDLNTLDDIAFDELQSMARNPRVVAIGEVGLDYYWHTYPKEEQIDALQKQLQLALGSNLPVIIHCRDAYGDLLNTLKGFSHLRGVLLHSFAGTYKQAEESLAQGYYLGVGGPITYKKAMELRDIIRTTPLERIMLETDAPYLAPQPMRGKRNEPSFITYSVDKIAEIHHLPYDHVVQQTGQNALAFFSLPL